MVQSSNLREVLSGLAGPVVVVDVSARDGLQSEPVVLSPQQRAAWIRALLDAGVPAVEAGSFVSPDLVPQMAGTADVLAELPDVAEKLWVLVPNRRGLHRALAAGARNVVLLASATETHSVANLGGSIQRVLSDLGGTVEAAAEAGLRVRLAVSMVWIDPVEGTVPARQVLEICERGRALGIKEVTLCDTYGGASPRAVAELLEDVFDLYPREAVGLHLHDTFGGASACALVGLCLGVRRFDASIAGLGGCPFAKGAKGNLPTEHLDHLLRSLGMGTGINPALLTRAIGECLQSLECAGYSWTGPR